MSFSSTPPQPTSASLALLDIAQQAQRGDVHGAALALRVLPIASEAAALWRALEAALEGTLRIYDGHYQESLAQVLPAVAMLEASLLADSIDWVYTGTAYALGMLGDPVRGLEWCARALSLPEGSPWSAGRRKVLSTQGTLLAMAGSYEAAWPSLIGSLAVAQRENVPRGVVVALGNMAYCCIDEALKLDSQEPRRRELAERALPHASDAVALAREHGLDLFVGFASTSQSMALLLLGDVQAAEAAARVAVAGTAKHLPMQTDALLALATVCRHQGKHAEAWQALHQAEGVAAEAGVQLATGRLLDEAVALALAEGDRDTALDYAQRSTQYWRELHASRLKVLATHAALFKELEQSRLEARTLRQESAAWADAALHDPLSGLLNRRGLDAGHRALRAQAFGVALIDADHFKRINDTLGHACGDAVLMALAQVLRTHTRHDDLVARIGGEEFVVLMPGATPEVMQRRCEAIRGAVSAHPWRDLAPDLAVTVSIGFTLAPALADLEAPLARADAALYAAKSAGRDRVVFHAELPRPDPKPSP